MLQKRGTGSYGTLCKRSKQTSPIRKSGNCKNRKAREFHAALEEMVAHLKSILEDLELPFRILRLCGGDTGFCWLL